MDNVIIIKLASGEELIAIEKERGSEFLTLDKPYAMAMSPNQQGGMSVTMIPWFITMPDGNITAKVFRKDIASELITPIPPELEKQYLTRVTKIQLL